MAQPHRKGCHRPEDLSLGLVFFLSQAPSVARSPTWWRLMPGWDLRSEVQAQRPQEGLPGSS